MLDAAMNLLILPEIGLLLLAGLILTIDLLTPDASGGRRTFTLAWVGLTIIFLLLVALPTGVEKTYLGTYRVTGLGLLFKQVFTLSALCTVLLSRSYFTPQGSRRGRMKNQGEFYTILLVCTLGTFTVVSSTDLLTLFIGMEMATIPLYALSAFLKNDEQATEASTKYIIMGSLSTGLLLFGYSLLYGAGGSIQFAQLLAVVQADPAAPLLNLGVLFVLAAIGFKLTLFPFHMWAPDVYEGAPTPVTAFLAISSKATAVAFLIMLLHGPLAPMQPNLTWVLLLLAATTMTVGNLGALRQQNLRRFMAYSSIAQAGYIIMALSGKAALAQPAIIFYLLVYGAANYATFFIISLIGRNQDENFAALRGLGKQHPALALILMLSLFSLGGIPPLAGFMGKFLLFAAAAEQGHYFMVIFAALNSTVSLYYYLLLIKEAYITAPPTEPLALRIELHHRAGLMLLTLGMIVPAFLPRILDGIDRLIG